MYGYENTPVEWFTSGRRSNSSYYPPPMSRPVSKSFNRISDFIFPDSVHIQFPQQQQHSGFQRYQRAENYSLPVLNRRNFNQRDLIIVERLPADEFDNIDLLYREQSHRPVRRRYSSIIDERRIPSNERTSTGLTNRSATHRERVRDRRKRHTTDNVYHSMLKTMLQRNDQQYTNDRDSNCILSYRTTLNPITDSESMTSIHQQQQQQQQQQHINTNSYSRVPINGTRPIITDYERSRQPRRTSSISSRDSSTDTDINERHPITMNHSHYRQDSSYINSSNILPTVWERLPSNPLHQPDRFIPINPSTTDTNNHETMSYSNNLITSSPFDNVINYQINNPTLSQDSAHHVSLCVDDLHTTLFIDEDTLNNTKTNTNHGGKAHIRKRNTLVDGSIISTDYHSHNQTTRRTNTDVYRSLDTVDENKSVRPYFLIQPQTVLMLPNETAKFKCCFGGDPLPTLTWSHNESRIPEILAAGGTTSSRYRTHKLHDIYYLDIGPVNLRDNGQIKCTIMNRFGREETIAQLFVVPSPADATPYIMREPNDVTVIEGQPLKVSCTIVGLQVTVNWFHNGKLISPTTQSKSDYNDETTIFTLSCCMRIDAGTVDCHVKNRFGEARTSCHIEVIEDPEFDR